MKFTEAVSDKKEIDSPKAFLYGIGKNVFFGYLKRKYVEVNLDESTLDFVAYSEQTVETYESEDKLEKLVKNFVSKLPEKQQTVLELRLIKRNSLQEICEQLKKDMNYVKTTQKRGIKRLKELLEQEFTYSNKFSTPKLT